MTGTSEADEGVLPKTPFPTPAALHVDVEQQLR